MADSSAFDFDSTSASSAGVPSSASKSALTGLNSLWKFVYQLHVIVFAAADRSTVHSSWLWDRLDSFSSLLGVVQQQGCVCRCTCLRMCVCVPGRHEVCCHGAMEGLARRNLYEQKHSISLTNTLIYKYRLQTSFAPGPWQSLLFDHD